MLSLKYLLCFSIQLDWTISRGKLSGPQTRIQYQQKRNIITFQIISLTIFFSKPDYHASKIFIISTQLNIFAI